MTSTLFTGDYVSLQATGPNLLNGPVVLAPYAAQRQLRPAMRARVATLERQAPQLVGRARDAGVDIQFIGASPLFCEHRLYHGPKTDWVFGPADEREEIVIPQPQRQALRRLRAAGIDFPLTYYAHEVDKRQTDELLPVASTAGAALDRTVAAELVGPVPAPAGALELGERLGQRSATVLHAVGEALPVIGMALLAVAAAPVVLAAGAIASLAVVDPIVFGVIPAAAAEAGEPGLWYQLVAWQW